MKKVNAAITILATSATLVVGTAFALNDSTAVGRMLIAKGGVLIQRNVHTDVAGAGSIVGVGDTILTTDTGTTQWQMSDDSVFVMAPDSGFKINQYAMPSPQNANGVAGYTLLQGAIHTITGKIGRGVAANPAHSTYSSDTGRFNAANLIKVAAAPTGPYTLKTALGVITTKGADFTAVIDGKSLKVMVGEGAATVCTVAGCSVATPGQGIFVNCDGCKPTFVSISGLGLESLSATLAFNGLGLGGSRIDQTGNPSGDTPRTQPPACRGVSGQVQGSSNCQNPSSPGVPGGPGIPVSPN